MTIQFRVTAVFILSTSIELLKKNGRDPTASRRTSALVALVVVFTMGPPQPGHRHHVRLLQLC